MSGWDPAIFVVESCAAREPVCLADADRRGTTGEETTSWSNDGNSPKTVFIVVDGRSEGDFTLTVQITAAPYVKTLIPTACVTLSNPTNLIPIVSDEAVSAVFGLPFSFNFFGAPVTSFGVSTNGFLQFTTQSIAAAPVNLDIPSTAAPNGLIGVFWEDLAATAGGMPRVASSVSGVSPSRVMTVEWRDVGIYRPSPAVVDGRIRMQARLYEGSDVIELHYCSISSGSDTLDRYTGAGATIGLENAAGTAGVQHSFDSPNAINTSTALRFSP